MYPLTCQLYCDISHIAHFQKNYFIFHEFNFQRSFSGLVLLNYEINSVSALVRSDSLNTKKATPESFTGVATYVDYSHPLDSNPYRNDVHPCFFIIFYNYVSSVNLFYGLNGDDLTWCTFSDNFSFFHRNYRVTVTYRLINVV